MSIFHKDIIRGPSAPPPAPPREVHLSIWGQSALIADKVTGARLVPEPTGVTLTGSHFVENRLTFLLPPGTSYGWGAQLHLEADGYQPLDQRVFLAPDLDVEMLPVAPLAEGLIIDGAFFRTAVTRQPFTVIGCSDFNLLARYLADEDITPILEQRQALGFNWLRVWTAFPAIPGIGKLSPIETPTLYDRAPVFATLAARYGFTVEFTGFASPRAVFSDAAAQVQHWEALTSAVAGMSTVLLELANENDQGSNAGLALDRLTRPTRNLASRGSNGSQAQPVQPPWDYQVMHCNDASEWQRKVGHNSYEIWSGPTIADENTRAPDRFSSTQLAYDAAAGAALLCAGSTFHSVQGKMSALWEGIELDCAKAWVAGAKSVPLACQVGPYVHRDDLEGSSYLRVYERHTGDSACIVRIRR